MSTATDPTTLAPSTASIPEAWQTAGFVALGRLPPAQPRSPARVDLAQARSGRLLLVRHHPGRPPAVSVISVLEDGGHVWTDGDPRAHGFHVVGWRIPWPRKATLRLHHPPSRIWSETTSATDPDTVLGLHARLERGTPPRIEAAGSDAALSAIQGAAAHRQALAGAAEGLDRSGRLVSMALMIAAAGGLWVALPYAVRMLAAVLPAAPPDAPSDVAFLAGLLLQAAAVIVPVGAMLVFWAAVVWPLRVSRLQRRLASIEAVGPPSP